MHDNTQIPFCTSTRNGARIRLRALGVDDAAQVGELNRAIVRAADGVILKLDEVPDSDEFWKTKITSWLEKSDDLLIAAEDRDAIVGIADIRRMQPDSLRDNAVLTMGVHPERQGEGIGRILFEAAMAWASRVDIYRIELYTLANNYRAISLYRSGGFKEVHRRRNFVRLEGQLIDDIVMEWTS